MFSVDVDTNVSDRLASYTYRDSQDVYVDTETGTVLNGPIYKVSAVHINGDGSDSDIISAAYQFGSEV